MSWLFPVTGLCATLATVPAVAGMLYVHAPLALHRGPGDSFGVTSTVAPGTAITVLWCNADADWCLVNAGPGQGWAPLEALKVPRPGGTAGAAATTAAGSNGAAAATATSAGTAADSTGVSVSVSAPGVAVGVTIK